MGSKKIPQEDNANGNEEMLNAIITKLHAALPGLKEYLGEKKLEKRISKAAKILVHGIKITPPKKVIAVKKKTVKTKSKEKTPMN